MRRALLFLVLSLLAAFVMVLPATAASKTVDIEDSKFVPQTINITVGDEVVWVQRGELFHTITSEDGSFRRGEVENAGDTHRHTFTKAGRFSYFCEPHKSIGMTGVVVVQEATPASTAPTTAPPATTTPTTAPPATTQTTAAAGTVASTTTIAGATTTTAATGDTTSTTSADDSEVTADDEEEDGAEEESSDEDVTSAPISDDEDGGGGGGAGLLIAIAAVVLLGGGAAAVLLRRRGSA